MLYLQEVFLYKPTNQLATPQEMAKTVCVENVEILQSASRKRYRLMTLVKRTKTSWHNIGCDYALWRIPQGKGPITYIT